MSMQLLNYLPLSRGGYQVPKYEENQIAGYYLHTYSLELVLPHSRKSPAPLW